MSHESNHEMESNSEQSLKALKSAVKDAEALNMLIECIEDKESMEDIIETALDSIRNSYDWEYGSFWKIDSAENTLKFFSDSGHTHNDFKKINKTASFSKGEGLCGRAWNTQDVYFAENITEIRDCPRASIAKRHKIQSALCIPLEINNDVIGTIDFLSHKRISLNDEQLNVFRNYARIISNMLKRSHEIENLKSEESNSSRLKTALDNAQTNIMIADNDLRIVYLNETLENMLKENEADIKKSVPAFSADNLIGRCVDDFHKKPEHQRNIIKNLHGSVETNLELGDLIFNLIVTPINDKSGKRIGTSVEWDNITEKLINEKKQEEATQVRMALDGASTNVMIANMDMEIIYMNQTLEKMLQKSESAIRKDVPNFRSDNLIGTCVDVFHKNPEHQRNIIKTLSAPTQTQLRLGGRTFNLIVTPVSNEKGEKLGACVEWSDITEQLIEEEKQKEAAELISKQSIVLNAMADGDLTNMIEEDFKEEDHQKVKNYLNKAVGGMNQVLHQTSNVVQQVSQSVTQIQATSEQLASSSNQQASAVEEVSASVEETDSQVRANADNASMANQLVSETADTAHDGQKKMELMMEAINAISNSSQEIAKIIKVIDEIAFQTNLLALNAAVEAARAGKHGKGFAVVAQEVRNLAGRSAKAAKETAELIDNSGKKVEEGVSIAKDTADSLGEIVGNVVKVKDLVAEIATASDEQTKGIAQINTAIGQVNEGVQSVNEQSTELASAANKLTQLANTLNSEVGRFKLSDNTHYGEIDQQLPNGITPEMLQQLLQNMSANQKVSHTSVQSNKHSQIDTKKELPLDHDERGFEDF